MAPVPFGLDRSRLPGMPYPSGILAAEPVKSTPDQKNDQILSKFLIYFELFSEQDLDII
jgi:hypothetical protein